MGTKELARIVGQAARQGDAVIMENHGVLTVGETLFRAFDRMEILEAAARMTWIAATMGCSRPLTEARIREIEEVYGVRDSKRTPAQ